jgi:hypothetical protein
MAQLGLRQLAAKAVNAKTSDSGADFGKVAANGSDLKQFLTGFIEAMVREMMETGEESGGVGRSGTDTNMSQSSGQKEDEKEEGEVSGRKRVRGSGKEKNRNITSSTSREAVVPQNSGVLAPIPSGPQNLRAIRTGLQGPVFAAPPKASKKVLDILLTALEAASSLPPSLFPLKLCVGGLQVILGGGEEEGEGKGQS